jgi:hypothetical protein
MNMFLWVETFRLIVHVNFTLSTCLVNLKILKYFLKSKGPQAGGNFHFFCVFKAILCCIQNKETNFISLKKGHPYSCLWT